eukprot:6130545-Pyramimonas_sp.AAC.1
MDHGYRDCLHQVRNHPGSGPSWTHSLTNATTVIYGEDTFDLETNEASTHQFLGNTLAELTERRRKQAACAGGASPQKPLAACAQLRR